MNLLKKCGIVIPSVFLFTGCLDDGGIVANFQLGEVLNNHAEYYNECIEMGGTPRIEKYMKQKIGIICWHTDEQFYIELQKRAEPLRPVTTPDAGGNKS